MKKNNAVLHASMVALVASSLFVGGCATKKYVRGQVQPVGDKLATVDQRTTQNTGSIENLDRQVSRAGERITDVDSKATAAGQAATKAGELATVAGQRADAARQVADQSLSKTGELARTVDNIDNFQVVTTESVLFPFNKSTLTKEAKQQLDTMAQSVAGMKRYVVEVTGFTDKTGGREYNQALSEKRANTVIRYLTLNHQVPLRNIRVIGVGEEAPAMATDGAAAMPASTATAMPTSTATAATAAAPTDAAMAEKPRMTRKEARRVEVKVFAPAGGNGQPATQSSTVPTADVAPATTTAAARQ